MERRALPRAPWLTLYTLSGTCSLSYQILWARLFQQVLGSTVYALSLVTALFMAGLALGSRLGGRWADGGRMETQTGDRPPGAQPAGDRGDGDGTAGPAISLRRYALVELVTAGLAFASFLVVPALEPLMAAVSGASGPVAAADTTVAGAGMRALAGMGPARLALTLLLPLVTVLPVTTAMGVSMPLLTRALARRARHVGGDAGQIYVLNTAGALAGATLTGFLLIRFIGVTATWMGMVAVNAVIGLVALLMVGRMRRQAGEGTRTAVAEWESPVESLVSPEQEIGRRLLVVLFVISGFISFGYELFWTRSLITVLGNSTYAVTSTLLATLLGLTAGSAIITRVVDRIRRPVLTLGLLEAGIGITSMIALPLLVETLYTRGVQSFFFAEGGDWWRSVGMRFAAAAAVLFVPSTLNGATLPLMLRTMTRSMRSRGTDIGTAYAADAAGNVLGTLLPAFLMLPLLGIFRGLLVLGALNLALAVTYALPRTRRWIAAPAAAGLLALVMLVPASFQFPSDTYAAGDAVLFYEEGVEATTRVYRKQDTGARHMSVDGVFIGGSGDAAQKELVLAHLHAALRPRAHTALTVGLGSGVLASELAGYDHLERIDVVEIAPSVARGARAFPSWRAAYPGDARVHLVVDDVTNYLLQTDARYDLIVSDGKSRPTARGNGLFFSSDYYALAQRRLAPNGLFMQWLSLHLAPPDLRTIIRTFTASFEHVALWWLPDADAFLVGSNTPFTFAGTQGARPPRGMARYGVTNPADTGRLLLATDDRLRELAGDGPLNTLDRPIIEFFDPADYRVTAGRMIGTNLRTISRELETGSELAHFVDLMASAYTGNVPAEELDARAAALNEASAPVATGLARYYLARTSGWLRAGDVRRALEYAEQAVTAAPSDTASRADAHYYRGVSLLQLGRADEGRRDLEAAVRLAPEVPIYRITLARALSASGRQDAAIAQYRAVLATMPENISALQSIGVTEAAEGNWQRARELLARAYELAPERPSVVDSYAWVLYQAGEARTARRVVRRAGDYHAGRSDFAERRATILGDR